MRIRWSENDKYFGPFTYASGDYNRIAIVLGSGDGDDYPGCRLRFSAFRRTLIIALPAIIKPWQRWQEITTEPTRSKMIEQGRNSGYWETGEREYGFTYGEGHLSVALGRTTNDSHTEQRWGCFLPWTQWRFVRHSFYDLDGVLFYTLPQRRGGAVLGKSWHHQWDVERAIENLCPTAKFEFSDFDGERITATTKIEEREWKFGERPFKWLSFFRKNKIRRSLDIDFSSETGRRKGSWKGGTVGHSIDMLPGELHEAAFRRYCAEHDMTFIGLAIETPDAQPTPEPSA